MTKPKNVDTLPPDHDDPEFDEDENIKIDDLIAKYRQNLPSPEAKDITEDADSRSKLDQRLPDGDQESTPEQKQKGRYNLRKRHSTTAQAWTYKIDLGTSTDIINGRISQDALNMEQDMLDDIMASDLRNPRNTSPKANEMQISLSNDSELVRHAEKLLNAKTECKLHRLTPPDWDLIFKANKEFDTAENIKLTPAHFENTYTAAQDDNLLYARYDPVSEASIAAAHMAEFAESVANAHSYQPLDSDSHDNEARSISLAADIKAGRIRAANVPTPKTYKQAVDKNNPYRLLWIAAIKEELDNMTSMSVFKEAKLPEGKKRVMTTWTFKAKSYKGMFEKAKARLVVRGDTMRADIDYDSHVKNTYAPVSDRATILTLLADACQRKHYLKSIDFTASFCNSIILDEPHSIYLSFPQGYVRQDSSKNCLLCIKGLYGMKISAQRWWTNLKRILLSDPDKHPNTGVGFT